MYLYFCGLLSLFLVGTTSCTDYLDREPDSVISSDDAFKNFTNFQGFVEQMYNLAPDIAKANWVARLTGVKMKLLLSVMVNTYLVSV
jgi:hypothetical protein